MYYIYFQETPKVKLNYPSNLACPIFGLDNISDLQRNYYLQNDPNVYTFIGFSKLDYLQDVISDCSSKINPLVSNALNGCIYNYQNKQTINLLKGKKDKKEIIMTNEIDKNQLNKRKQKVNTSCIC